jgi:AraC-like DNA-binding protein
MRADHGKFAGIIAGGQRVPTTGHLMPASLPRPVSRPLLPRSAPTVLADLPNALLRYADRQGLDRARVFASAGVDPRALEPREGRVLHADFNALWSAIERQTGDPDLGLSFAASGVGDGEYGVVGFLAMTSPTLGEGLARVVANHPVLKEDAEVALRRDDRRAYFEQGQRGGAPWSRAIIDHGFASIVMSSRTWTDGAFAPSEIRFQHRRPQSTGAYERMFGCPVLFEQHTNAIVFDGSALDLALRSSQAELAGYFAGVARAALEKLSPGDLPAAVRVAIRDALPEGDMGLPRIARRLGVGARTLQRRLNDEKLVYRDLVDEVRRAEAVELVRSTDLSIFEISDRLGYSETKAFRRAFRRWTGAAPADARRAIL